MLDIIAENEHGAAFERSSLMSNYNPEDSHSFTELIFQTGTRPHPSIVSQDPGVL